MKDWKQVIVCKDDCWWALLFMVMEIYAKYIKGNIGKQTRPRVSK